MAPPDVNPSKRPRLGERTLLACTGCKQRKLKCDGQSPRCLNCVKTSRTCLVEDPATGLQRPRNHLQSLEAHVAHLETLLRQTRPDVANDHLADTSTFPEGPLTGVDVTSSPGATTSPGTRQIAVTDPAHESLVPSHESDADELPSKVALLCISAAGREPHYFGPSSALSFSRIASRTMGLKGQSDSFAIADEPRIGSLDGLSHSAQLKLPPAATAVALSSAYFHNIHPQYPFLHWPTFKLWEEECITASENNVLSTVGDVPLYFVLMVYAIGYLVHGPGKYDAAEELYAMALDRIGPLLDIDGLESVQSILCCAVYSIRSPVGASLWNVSGLAMRHCVELGYHRSAERYRKSSDTLTKEMSKRCFWVAYDIDRVVSCILGRPEGIADHHIDAELPMDIDDEYITTMGPLQQLRKAPFEPPTSMSGAIHGIKLRRLWSRFTAQLYPSTDWYTADGTAIVGLSVEGLRKDLEDWRSTIPDSVGCDPRQQRSVFASREWFHLAYHHSILLLYRPHITGPRLHDNAHANANIVESAFRECFAKSRDMCFLYRKLYQRPSIQFTWGSLHILFLGGLTYLYCLWRSRSVRQSANPMDVMNTCMACTTVLVIIAERWNMATSYRDIFGALAERTITMLGGESGPPTEAPIEAVSHEPAYTQTDELPLDDWLSTLDEFAGPESQWFAQQLTHGDLAFADLFSGAESSTV